jgi:hypothetical protein
MPPPRRNYNIDRAFFLDEMDPKKNADGLHENITTGVCKTFTVYHKPAYAPLSTIANREEIFHNPLRDPTLVDVTEIVPLGVPDENQNHVIGFIPEYGWEFLAG